LYNGHKIVVIVIGLIGWLMQVVLYYGYKMVILIVVNMQLLWQNGVVNLITETRPSTNLLQHMMQQCYRRAVTNPDNLKQYRPFSPEVGS